METKEEKTKQLTKEENRWRVKEVRKSRNSIIVTVVMAALLVIFNAFAFSNLNVWGFIAANMFILLIWFVLQAILVSLHNDKFEKTIQIPDEVYEWLSKTKCTNRKSYIECSKNKKFVYDWVQNKQLARELLTYPKIKGNLTDAEVERVAPTLFFYPKESAPLRLAKDKPKGCWDSEALRNFLATLQVPE